MSVCGEYRARILHYVDNSLQGKELTDFRAHLECCENCRAAVETERGLSQLLRRSRPLYSASLALRARMATTVELHTTADAAKRFWKRILRMLGR